MAENGSELRRIAWSQAFPFVRLFHTLRLALNLNRLALAMACIVCLCLGGWVLDGIWSRSGGVTARPKTPGTAAETEIEVYARSKHSEFATWLREAKSEHEQRAFLTLRQANKAATLEEAQEKLATQSLRELLIDDSFEKDLDDLKQLVDQRLGAGLEALDKDTAVSRADRREKRQALIEAADTVRRMLAGTYRWGPAAAARATEAIEEIVKADPAVEEGQWTADHARLEDAAERQANVREYEELEPRGPFSSLLRHERHCFAAAVQGVCSGRWGFSGGAFDPEPAMAGSIESAARGVGWLLNQRPWYALLFGVFNLVVFALFGGAICRSAAVQSVRDESISIRESLHFVWDRYGGFVLAPLLPVVVLIGIAVLMFIGGLIGAIPYLGELFTGVLYPLALLLGFGAAVLVLATVLGFHLMWPTIAVEGSDGFDALSRACSYVASRIWHCGFYSFVLLLYGALSFVLVRLVLMLMLKLSHKFTGWGMNLISSAELGGNEKLNAMWMMPAWADLSLVPSTSGAPLWGTFFNGPLDGTETVGAALIMVWVFLTVGLLGAFVISYFFCGSTQMYFLLRRDVDATDWDEIYYEEAEEELPGSETPAPVAGEPPAEEAAPSEAAPSEPAPSDAVPSDAAPSDTAPSDTASSDEADKPDDDGAQS